MGIPATGDRETYNTEPEGSRVESVIYQLRDIDPENQQDLESIAELHMQLLPQGPMARLGKMFLRRFCYTVLLKDNLMRGALFEIAGQPAGFIAYTAYSITFHRRAIRYHLGYVVWLITVSILRSPGVLLRLLKALMLMFSRRAERERERDPLGEVLAIGVLPRYRSAAFVKQSGLQIGEILVRHAASYFRRAGVRRMRMVVETNNTPTLLFYHRLGARFEPYEHAGEPMVHVWFDLKRDFLEDDLVIPPCWSLDSTPLEGNCDPPRDWEGYWDSLRDDQRMFRAEADEFVRKLEPALALKPNARVLDFGCGFGFVADMLAPKTRELFLWDASANMRRRARLNVAGRQNIRFLDLSDAFTFPNDARVDLILVNSVIQYMGHNEFAMWLARWRDMLAPGGRLFISDLIPPEYNPIWDLVTFLSIGARRGFLLGAVRDGLGEVRRYWRMRRAQPLGRMGREDLRERAAAAGFSVEFLSVNIAVRSRRITAVLSNSNVA